MKFTPLTILLVLTALTAAQASAHRTFPAFVVQESNRQKAEQLWELSIAAKGGRERLYGINNLQLSIREKQWWNLKRVPLVEEALYVFPEKSWEWKDQRGTIFGFSIWLRNYEQNIRLAYSDHDDGKGGSVNPISEGGRGGRSSFIDTQLNYLMETQWVKPIPVSVESGKIGRHKVDVVRTIVKAYPNGEERVAFALDRKSHLPRQVIYYSVRLGKEYSGAVSLSDYVGINGIQMPTKVRGIKTSYQFNVQYDEQIFEQAPSFEAGIDAWKKRK
jgi:hypothetical protein